MLYPVAWLPASGEQGGTDDEEYRVAGYDFGGPGVGATGGLSQIGFYGPPRVVSLTATFHY